ncbi:MAG: hypothetical protein IJS03_08250 [Eubacterium sp.]|nr:hypothetical protein [Eubacterium sp.]
MESYEKLSQYADTLLPCVYDDYIGDAKAVLTKAHKDKLRGLLNFKFKKHPRYNLPDGRLKYLEKKVQERARLLLE